MNRSPNRSQNVQLSLPYDSPPQHPDSSSDLVEAGGTVPSPAALDPSAEFAQMRQTLRKQASGQPEGHSVTKRNYAADTSKYLGNLASKQ